MSSVIEDLDRTAEMLGRVAVEAGRLLAGMADRRTGHQIKEDGSPSTAADTQSERLILSRLAAIWPDIPAIAEESGGVAGAGEMFFLVDPLDGTRDYVAGAPEYSVNIALVRGRRPIAAALAAPGLNRVWVAGTEARVSATDATDSFAWQPARVRAAPEAGLVALVSRRHGDPETDACLRALPIERLRTSSSAVKFGLVASGEADIYVRCGPTMEWDTAAGDHVLACAGGVVVGRSGEPLTYGHAERGYRNGAFVALGDPSLAGRVSLPEPS